MTWRDDLRKVTIDGREVVGASFRGVPFFVESSERGGGRRVVSHEFPLRDKPFVEDMGKRAATFRVEGYVIGEDYVAKRDALREALEETSGPGELVHPYHGVRTAICTTLSIHETRPDGRMATFSIEFADAPAQAPTPTIAPDLPGKVAAAADAAAAASSAQLAADFDTTGLPAFAVASAQAAIAGAAASLAARLGPVVKDAQELAALNGQLNLLAAEATSLARQPATAVEQMRTAIRSIVTTAENAPGDLLSALADAYDDALGTTVIATTLTRAKELANQTALVKAIRSAIAIEAARLAPIVPYASVDDATAARDRVTALLDEQAGNAGDTAYAALVALRAVVMLAVPGPALFPRVTTATRRTAIPSLILAYQLYGSVQLESDVLARNKIRHPGFVTGDLKVLSDGA